MNLCGDWLFVVKMGMGAPGAAWATVIAQVAAFALLVRHETLHGAKETQGVIAERFAKFGAYNKDGMDPQQVATRTMRGVAERVRCMRKFLSLCLSPAMALVGKASIGMILAATVGICGTVSLATHQILYGVYQLLCPMGEAMSQTLQSILPAANTDMGTSNAPGTKAGDKQKGQADVAPTHRDQRRLTATARGLVAAFTMACVGVGAVNAVLGGSLPRFFPGVFTTSGLVAAKLAVMAPAVGGCLLLHALSTTLEGVLFATGDAAFVGTVYPINSLIALGVSALIRRSGTPGLGMIWTAFVAYQALRLSEFALRILFNQRRGPKATKPAAVSQEAVAPVVPVACEGSDVLDMLLGEEPNPSPQAALS